MFEATAAHPSRIDGFATAQSLSRREIFHLVAEGSDCKRQLRCARHSLCRCRQPELMTAFPKASRSRFIQKHYYNQAVIA
jgi:hypothetical protein